MSQAKQRSLGGHAARGGAYVVVGQVVKVLLQAASLVILSRVLTPSEFGIIAFITAVVGFGELFRDFGLTPASIQSPTLSQGQASNLFWVNTSIGVVLGALLAVSGPLLATILGQSELIVIAPFVGLSFVFVGAQAQFQVALSRRMKFATLVITDVVAQLIATTTAVLLAIGGAGIWALVAQILVAQFSTFVLRAIASRWLPSLPRRGAGIRKFFNYGGYLFAAQLLTYLASNVDTYLIGARWGAVSLGLYNRAFTLMTLPVRQALVPLTNVMLPVLSRTADDDQRFYRFLLRLQFGLGAAVIWAYLTAVALAPDIIEVVLGAQWLEASSIFRLLAVGGAFQILSHLNYWVFLSRGITRSLFRYNILTKTFTVALLVAASFVSVDAVAAAYAMALAVSWPINVYWLRNSASMPMRSFLINGLSILCAGALAALAAFLTRQALGGGWLLVVPVLVSAGAFLGCLVALPATRPLLREMIGRVMNRLSAH